jgi:hypothetical protein
MRLSDGKLIDLDRFFNSSFTTEKHIHYPGGMERFSSALIFA